MYALAWLIEVDHRWLYQIMYKHETKTLTYPLRLCRQTTQTKISRKNSYKVYSGQIKEVKILWIEENNINMLPF
jgi:hypothetical protein